MAWPEKSPAKRRNKRELLLRTQLSQPNKHEGSFESAKEVKEVDEPGMWARSMTVLSVFRSQPTIGMQFGSLG